MNEEARKMGQLNAIVANIKSLMTTGRERIKEWIWEALRFLYPVNIISKVFAHENQGKLRPLIKKQKFTDSFHFYQIFLKVQF